MRKWRYHIYMIKTIINCIIFVLGMTMFFSCDDGDSFTTSPSNMLTFSTDTVKLDTVFSTVPSSTRSFWVYNRSGDGLRCKSVRLEGGNQTGFRANVDGVYLSPEQGYKASDIEVRNKDSIRVYVELTSVATNSDLPKRLSDNLVFTLESGREQKVALDAWTWDARFMRNTKVESDMTLSAGKPLVVYGMMTVEEGVTLTIDAGATLYFHGDAGIDVKGRIVCKGTPTAPVTFRGDRLDHMFDYLPYDRMSGQWQGIHIAETSYDNQIDYTDIHSAFNGVQVDSSDVARQTLDIRNSIIHNCQGNALGIVNSKVVLENCQLTNALGNCLSVDGGDVTVNSSTLAQFYPFDAMRGSAIYFSGINHPLVAINCTNTLITGYSNDELMGGKPSDDNDNAFNYSFANCIIRTPEPDDWEIEGKNFKDVVFEDVEDTISCGRKHFVLVDGDKQHYDFHLRKESAAVDKANPETSAKTDRDGRERDQLPDVGAYEYIKTEE